MNTKKLQNQFARMGARLKIGPLRPHFRDYELSTEFRLDVKADHRGEYFELLVRDADDAEIVVGHLDVADRHLLLLARDDIVVRRTRATVTRRLLCGHDERHWFAATVPGSAPTVARAREALKPAAVREAQDRAGVKTSMRNRRRNAAFLRQGEWFFVPAPELAADPWLVLEKEPLRRGRSKPHIADFVFRRGGYQVRVCSEYPSGLTEEQYRDLLLRAPEKARLPWLTMSRDPEAYAQGRIRHPDHQTIRLPGWHRVLPNREADAPGHAVLTFLD